MNPWWFGVPAGVISVFVSFYAWRTSVNAVRQSFRPVLRPAPWRDKTTKMLITDRMLLKNVGSGPALSVVLYQDATPPLILGTLDVVERLGAHVSVEKNVRVGRDFLLLKNQQLEYERDYGLAYQDLEGAWHLTQVRTHPRGLTTRHRGRERWRWRVNRAPSIPAVVKRLAQVELKEGRRT